MHTWSGFVAGYAWDAVFDFYIITTYMALDGLFVGLCVYAIAYLEDLHDHLRALDSHFLRTGDGRRLEADLVRAVRKHEHINGWLRQVARLFSGMILVQFVSGALLISDFVFQMQSAGGGRVAAFLMISVALLGQMFIYCFAATSVTYKVRMY